MTTSTGKINLLGLTQPEMEQFFDSIGEKRFRAGQVMKWIHHFGVSDFAAMTNVGKVLREKLEAVAEIRPPEVVSEDISADGTRKWVIRVAPAAASRPSIFQPTTVAPFAYRRKPAVPWTAASAPPASKASTATSLPPK